MVLFLCENGEKINTVVQTTLSEGIDKCLAGQRMYRTALQR